MILETNHNRHRRRRRNGTSRFWLLEFITVMIAASVAMRRQTSRSLLRIPISIPINIQPVHGLSTTRRFLSASPFQKGAYSVPQQQRSMTSGIDTFLFHSEQKRTRISPTLATAFVSSPETTSEEDEEEFLESEEWQDDNEDESTDAIRGLLLKDLNPSQIEAVTQPLRLDLEGRGTASIVTRVIAGPGSGKTKVLTTRIAHLLHEDPFGRVLAVTFTRKASGEMKERVERLLREQEAAALEGDGDDDDEFGGNQIDEYGEAILQETSQRPGEADLEGSTNPKGIERVELGTFHSICAKILRFNGELLRDLPSVRRDMSKAQPQWVEKLSPPGAGNDEYEDEDGDTSKPEMILVDPEINLNGQYAIADQTEQIRILNECLKAQKIDLKNTELKPIQILTSIGKMKEIFAQNQDPFVDERKQNGKFGGAGKALRTARKIYYPYREKLLANNAVDFDDLILLTRELLTEDEELRERLHRRWPHVLVDEYQDTSKIQMDLIKLLTSSSLFVVGDADQSIYSWRGAHVGSLEDVATDFENYGMVRTVFLKENYRSTSNIVKAAEKVISSGGGGPTNVLGEALAEAGVSEEERSQIDVDAAPPLQAKDDLRRAMKPKRGAGPSPRVVACEDERAEARFVVDTILNMTAHGDIVPGQDTVAMIYRTNAQSRYLEEACVQQNLPYVIRGGAGGFYKRAEIKDCLTFLRWLHNGNDEGSMVRAMKTPSKGIGEKAFGEFKDYCELVQLYMRQNAVGRAKPTYLDVLISMTNTEAGDGEHDFELPEGTPHPQDHITKRALNNFLKFSVKMRRVRTKAYQEPIGELLFFVIEELELMGHFDAISKSKTEYLERKENVQELRNAAKKYKSLGPALVKGGGLASEDDDNDSDDVMGIESAMSSFLDDVALVSDIAEANSDEANNRLVVNLMTIHASKGTEFDCVFVVGLEEGTLPTNQALQEGAGSVQLEEEKRLCYVAMTRAKTRLVLTWRKEVTSFSNWSDSGPNTQTKQRSRFLNAIVSKKSKKKNARTNNTNTKSKARALHPQAARTAYGTASQGASSNPQQRRKASTYSGRIDRSGLKGAEGRTSPNPRRRSPRPSQRQAPPPRRPASASTSARAGRVPPPRRTQQRSPAEEPYTPSLEGIEALRSSLGSTSAPNPNASSTQRRKANTKPKSNTNANTKSNTNAEDSMFSSSAMDAVDPMWFFPVGKAVVHMNLGKGTVVEPPPFRKIEDAKVRVKFDNGGKTLDFPALGSDILPDMGSF